MPNYTIELYKLTGPIDSNTDWKKIGDILGLNDYPIFDESYRERLNRDIVEFFYFREIGIETVERWKFALQRKMRMEMEVFNGLFESQRIKFDPLATIDMRTMTKTADKSSGEMTSTSAQTSEQKSASRSVEQSTPQVALKGNADYASGASDVNGKTNSNATGNDTSETSAQNDSEGESHTTGYQGTPAGLITAYRASLINVTMMLCERLEELFMGVWGTDDDFIDTEIRYNV